MSELLTKHFTITGVEMVPIVTGGSVQNPKLVNKKEVDIAITNKNVKNYKNLNVK